MSTPTTPPPPNRAPTITPTEDDPARFAPTWALLLFVGLVIVMVIIRGGGA